VNAWLFARKDLDRLRRAPMGLLIWACIPLLIGAMVALATGRAGGRMQVQLLIADQDDSFGSRMLVAAFEQSGIVRTEAVTKDAGRQRIAADDGSALLVVPAGFASAVLRREPTELQLLTNPAQRINPGIVEEFLRVLGDAVFAAQRLIGPEFERIRAEVRNEDSGEQWALASARIGNELAERVRSFVDPLRIELVDRSAPKAPDGDAGGGGDFGLRFWPGMLLMALFFVGQGLCEDLWEERRLCTLRRALSSPGGVRPWLLGKLLCAAVVAALVGVVGLGGGVLMFDLPLRTLLVGVPWVALVGAVLLLLLWPLACLASSARAANVLTSAVMFPLLMLGGSFFPFEAMPRWMAGIGTVTPNGWLLLRLRALIDGRFEPLQLALGIGGTLLLALVVVPFCSRRLVRGVGG
jgi:ABC-type Na+ efflux pump permease subunit